MTFRVLLVDDHAVVTEGLAVLLAGFEEVDVVGAARGGAEAVERYAQLGPDVVLMDLSMPDVDGVEATRRIVELDPGARVLALTGFLDEDLVARALGAGAKGYVLKKVGGRELADAIAAVARGGSILSAEALAELTSGSRPPRVGRDLTARETDVLELLARGLTNQQIADDLGLRHGTVRIHVSNILAKLHADNRTTAAHIARSEGLVRGGR